MIQVFKLTKRHMDENEKLPKELKEIKVFSTCVGHGVGTIDFSEKVLEIGDEEFERIIESSGEYVKFKIGNLSKYFEIEISPSTPPNSYRSFANVSLRIC